MRLFVSEKVDANYVGCEEVALSLCKAPNSVCMATRKSKGEAMVPNLVPMMTLKHPGVALISTRFLAMRP